MGEITKTAIRETAVDFSYPYFMTRVGFFTKKPLPLSKLNAILWPFHEYLWICLSGTIPIFCLVYWFFSKFRFGMGKFQKLTLGESVTHVMEVFIRQSMLLKKLH